MNWLLMKRDRHTMKKDKKTVFLVRITKEDKKEFYDMCDMQARNASEVLRRLMAKFCNEMRAKEKREG